MGTLPAGCSPSVVGSEMSCLLVPSVWGPSPVDPCPYPAGAACTHNNDAYTQKNFFFFPFSRRLQETCWTLSNIVAGTAPQMAAVCDSPGVLGGVIDLLSSDVWEVQKEANFVISNIATASNGELLTCTHAPQERVQPPPLLCDPGRVV